MTTTAIETAVEPDGVSTGVCLEHVSKSFGATHALEDVTLEFASGGLCVLAGENGSGKSTLVKIVAGVLLRDRGTVTIDGREIGRFSPRAALEAGVATCFQEVLVENNLTVLENIFLWDRGWLKPATSRKERVATATALLGALSADLNLSQPVELLGLAERQLIVIARALAHRSSVLLLDEPTAALDQRNSECVLDAFVQRARQGHVVVLTSHRMEEIERVADTVIVLRNGHVAGVLDRSELNEARLLHLMSGTAHVTRAEGAGTATPGESPAPAEAAPVEVTPPPADEPEKTARTAPAPSGEVAMRLRGVRITRTSPPIDLELRAGELTGFAGLDGHGQAQVLRLMAGLGHPAEGAVEMARAQGVFERVGKYRHSVHAGIVYVPRDRKNQGIFSSLSVLDNIGIATADQRSRFGFAGTAKARRELQPLVDDLAIQAASWRSPISSLSGGNQQKVLIARWLAARPMIILLDDPTRGVDLKTKQDLYVILRGRADEGQAVILVSTELEELRTVCDRVVVFHRSGCSADLRREGDEDIPREAILAAMFGSGGQP